MSINVDYLGMPLQIDDLDHENLAYFRHCAQHEFHLQSCERCGLVRYPPTTGCPWCAASASTWIPVDGRGTVHSYTEVHHAIQPAFKAATPYLVLIVDLDLQNGEPGEHDALRITGNLLTADGEFAPPDLVAQVGIGSRVRMIFKDVADGISIPHWTLDTDAPQPAEVWRYPDG